MSSVIARYIARVLNGERVEFEEEIAFHETGKRWISGVYTPTLLVAVTGWGQPADKEQAHLAGFDAHLTKPAGLDELRRVLARDPAGYREA